MRLAIALTVLVVAVGPAEATFSGRCLAHVHADALPWESGDGDAGMHPFVPQNAAPIGTDNLGEVNSIEVRPKGGPWVYQVHDYVYRLADVDLRGNCTKQWVR